MANKSCELRASERPVTCMVRCIPKLKHYRSGAVFICRFILFWLVINVKKEVHCQTFLSPQIAFATW